MRELPASPHHAHDDLHCACDAVLGADQPPYHSSTRPDEVVCRGSNGVRQTIRRCVAPQQWRRSRANRGDARTPERLVDPDRNRDGRDAGAQAGGGCSCATVMDGGGNPREEQAMGRAGHNKNIVATGCQTRNFRGTEQNAASLRKAERFQRQRRIIMRSPPAHAAKTDGNRRIAGCQEQLNLRRQAFSRIVEEPVAGHGMVRWPVVRWRDHVRAEAVDKWRTRYARQSEGVERRLS